jgi:hypothetical protein
MKIYSDTLTTDDIREAVPQGCYLALLDDGYHIREFGSERGTRTINPQTGERYQHGFKVILSGHAPHTSQGNTMVREQAATYDEWGAFIANLYACDDAAKIGPYKSGSDFDLQTNGAYPVVAA